MSENDYNPEGLTEDQIRIKLLEEQATASAQELSKTIDRLNLVQERKSKLEDQKYRAFEIIKNAVENEEIDADAQWLDEVGTIFGWEMTTEVEVSFTISGTASVKLPLGKSLEDFSFSASEVVIESDGWGTDADVSVEDYTLDTFDEN